MRRIVGAVCVIALLAAAVPARGADDVKVRAIIEKAIKAHGGADMLKKYKANIAKNKGIYYGMGDGIDFTSTHWLQLPDRMRTDVEADNFIFSQAINGDKGWRQFGDSAEDLDKEAIAEQKEDLNARRIAHLSNLLDKEYKLSALADAKVGDRPAVGVRVERKGFRDVSLYFDKENGRLLKSERRAKNLMMGGEEFTEETLYQDYRKVDAVLIAHQIIVNHDGKKIVESKVKEIKLYEKLDDKDFAKP